MSKVYWGKNTEKQRSEDTHLILSLSPLRAFAPGARRAWLDTTSVSSSFTGSALGSWVVSCSMCARSREEALEVSLEGVNFPSGGAGQQEARAGWVCGRLGGAGRGRGQGAAL